MPKKHLSTLSLNSPDTATSSLDLEPSPQIPATFTDGLPLPRLLVFDLDYTLWPFWVDTHVATPVKPANTKTKTNTDSTALNTAMIDAHGESFAFYRDVPGILSAARQKGITMGLASRTHAPDIAGIMLKNIMIPPLPSSSSSSTSTSTSPSPSAPSLSSPLRAWDHFTYREIYPGSKTTHFERIHAATGKKGVSGGRIDYDDMVFFDDESRNRDVERKHGVTFVLVRDGVTTDEVDRGIRAWRKRKGATAAETRQDQNDGENGED